MAATGARAFVKLTSKFLELTLDSIPQPARASNTNDGSILSIFMVERPRGKGIRMERRQTDLLNTMITREQPDS
jgi:hypothetical protein